MDPLTMMAIGAGTSIIGGMFSKPDDIDPNQIMQMMHSPYQDELHQRQQDLIDPNSGLMKTQLGVIQKQAADTTASTWRSVSREFADSDEGNIMKQWKDKFANQIIGSVGGQYNQLLANNINSSNNLLGQVANMDVNTRTAGASTIASNVTNTNQWRAGVGGGLMNFGGQMMSQGMGMG
tara:strand:- start:5293 stop:5829 length:537 start_codon:yes stop_codon:yes gene_type:complete